MIRWEPPDESDDHQDTGGIRLRSVTLSPTQSTHAAEKTISLIDANAFSELYEQTHLPVFRYIYGLHGGPAQDVEDLTAAAFERAWKTRRRFEGDRDAALGWLLVIAKRLVIDSHRRHRRRGTPADIEQMAIPAPGARLEDQALANERQQILWSLLHALPSAQREILVLRYVLGWQVRRIAAHLSTPENTVSVTIRRTLRRLRESWPPDVHSAGGRQEGDQ
jgi:RNA polymerase sigma-70 factor (ECF subfamily)